MQTVQQSNTASTYEAFLAIYKKFSGQKNFSAADDIWINAAVKNGLNPERIGKEVAADRKQRQIAKLRRSILN